MFYLGDWSKRLLLRFGFKTVYSEFEVPKPYEIFKIFALR